MSSEECCSHCDDSGCHVCSCDKAQKEWEKQEQLADDARDG